jgi:nickel-dependent lactate racemase
MKHISLPYGKTTLDASLPDFWNTAWLSPMPFVHTQSESEIIESALASPVGAAPLEDFLNGGSRFAVIVPDKTRMSRTDFYLPILLSRMEQAGISRDAITIVFANGTHAGMTKEEMATVTGRGILEKYRVVEHDSHASADMVYIGTTQYGTRVELNKAVAAADRVVATGAIVHHYFAGFGGGPKLLVPGVASYGTAIANHRRTLDDDGFFRTECRDGRLDGNPVAMDIRDTVRFFPPVYLFATILAADGSLAHAVCGDLIEAHRAGCTVVDSMYRVPVPKLVDCTIVSCGGYPKDINFIQAHKSLQHAHYATRPGGSIIFVSECRDGIGNERFAHWFDIESDDELRAAAKRDYVMNAHTAVSMRSKSRIHSIYCVTGLPDREAGIMGMRKTNSLQEAVDLVALANCNHKLRCLILENGSLTVPNMILPH